ncbi:hypothetical protein MASR2M15_21530 [Anaerolineales bacterium]
MTDIHPAQFYLNSIHRLRPIEFLYNFRGINDIALANSKREFLVEILNQIQEEKAKKSLYSEQIPYQVVQDALKKIIKRFDELETLLDTGQLIPPIPQFGTLLIGEPALDIWFIGDEDQEKTFKEALRVRSSFWRFEQERRKLVNKQNIAKKAYEKALIDYKDAQKWLKNNGKFVKVFLKFILVFLISLSFFGLAFYFFNISTLVGIGLGAVALISSIYALLYWPRWFSKRQKMQMQLKRANRQLKGYQKRITQYKGQVSPFISRLRELHEVFISEMRTLPIKEDPTEILRRTM